MVGANASETYQASYYKQMLDLLACDPNVRVINIFHLVDEPALAGWQSGLYWWAAPTPLPKLSAQVVHDWTAASGGACQGTLRPWTPNGLAAPTPVRAPKPVTKPRAKCTGVCLQEKIACEGKTSRKASCRNFLKNAIARLVLDRKKLKTPKLATRPVLLATMVAEQKAIAAGTAALQKLRL
jgi:hypothetical protein